MKKLSYLLILLCLSVLFACQSVKTVSTPVNKNFFVGERIFWPDKISSHLKTVTVNVTFPDHYQVLDGAQPYIKLMTAEGTLIEDHLMDKIPFTFTLKNKQINSSQLFADISIYYCRHDELAMCLKRDVLYEFSIDKHSEIHAVDINYVVQKVGY